MIPITGHRIFPIDPDTQDDIYESNDITQVFDTREFIDEDDPRFYPTDIFELDAELSINSKVIPKDLLDFIETNS